MPSSKQRVLALIEKWGLVRPRELENHGITRAQLARLVEDGQVVRQARGVYAATEHAPGEAHTLAHVAKARAGRRVLPAHRFCAFTS